MVKFNKKSLKKKITEKGLLILWILFIIGWNVFATYGVASWNGKLMDSGRDYTACDENEFPLSDVNMGIYETNGSIFYTEVTDSFSHSIVNHNDMVIWQNNSNDLIVVDPVTTISENVWSHNIVWVSKYSLMDLIDKDLLEWEISLEANSQSTFYIYNTEVENGAVKLESADILFEKQCSNMTNESISFDPIDLLTSKVDNGNGRIVFVLTRLHRAGSGSEVPFTEGEIIQFKFKRWDPKDAFYINKMVVWKIFGFISMLANFYLFLVCSGLHNPVTRDGRIDNFLHKRRVKKSTRRRY